MLTLHYKGSQWQSTESHLCSFTSWKPYRACRKLCHYCTVTHTRTHARILSPLDHRTVPWMSAGPPGTSISAEVASSRLGFPPRLGVRSAPRFALASPQTRIIHQGARSSPPIVSLPPYLQFARLPPSLSFSLSHPPPTTTLLTSSSCHVTSLLGLKIDSIETNGGRQTWQR